jgi:hypothetical protein
MVDLGKRAHRALVCVFIPRLSRVMLPVVLLLFPVLLVAASPLAVAAESGLAKRPRSGSDLTRWTRPRSSCSEEGDSPAWTVGLSQRLSLT